MVTMVIWLDDWVLRDEGVATGRRWGRRDEELRVGSRWLEVVCVAVEGSLQAVPADRAIRFVPDLAHPQAATAVVAEVEAVLAPPLPENAGSYTLASCGPARFWARGRLGTGGVTGSVSLAYDHEVPVTSPASEPESPPRNGWMDGVVARIRRVPVYIAPPRPGSPEFGRAAGVEAGFGAPFDVDSTGQPFEVPQTERFELPIDRPAPDAGYDGHWCYPERGGFWASTACLIHLELEDNDQER